MKHILILLSLMLCFGNVSGQLIETTNLACKIDKGKLENHTNPNQIFNMLWDYDYYLFKIKSPFSKRGCLIHSWHYTPILGGGMHFPSPDSEHLGGNLTPKI